jgi:PAS domain S-box-containing protein
MLRPDIAEARHSHPPARDPQSRTNHLRDARLAITQILTQAETVAEASPALLQAVCEALAWDIGILWTVDRRTNTLCPQDLWHRPGLAIDEFEQASRQRTFEPGIGLPGRVWSSRAPAWVADVVQDGNFPRAALAAIGGVHGAFACPIAAGGQILGVMEFFHHEVRAPDDDVLEMMAGIGGQIGQFLQRQQAVEALRASEARKAAIVQSALDCIITIDSHGDIIEFNPAAERTFGHRREDALGKSVAELIIPLELRANHHRGLAHYLATGEGPLLNRRIEVPALRADGTTFAAELAISVIATAGAPMFTAYLRDISARKQQEAIIEEQTRLAAFGRDIGLALNQMASLPGMLRDCAQAMVRHLRGAFARIWTLNEEEQILELKASAGLYTHTNGPHSRVPVGQYKIGLIARDRSPHLTNAVIGDPRIHNQEWAIREGMVSFAGYPLLVENRIVGVMAMFGRQPLSEAALAALASISNGIALGIERKWAEEHLREQRERFRTLANSIPQLAWMARPDGSIFWYNRRWYEYTGATPEQMEGWGWQSVHDPVELPRVLARYKAAFAVGDGWEDTFPLRRHDGQMRWHLSRAVPVRDERGKITLWFGTNTDITDRLRMEEDLRESRERLEERVRERTAALLRTNEALQREITERREAEERANALLAELQRSNAELEQFASVASHDLQEPLRKIQAFGDRLQDKCRASLSEQGKEYLDRMRSAAARMSTLINDLLAFSRVTTRAQPFSEVDLDREAQQVVADLEARLQQTGGRVELGPLPTLHADPTQMRQLLQNLIGNGLKFHRSEEPPVVKVEGRIVPGGDKAESQPMGEIRVTDNGIGFEEKYLDRIFQLFQRLHGRTEYEGTGLGLAICRKIVERHGGTITARSTPGQGATFVVTLPVRTPTEEVTP